jgi:hypothetical protein
MTTLRAHFDGRVLVPDEPVNLPKDTALEVQVREILQPETNGFPPAIRGVDSTTGLPVFFVPPGTKTITSEEVMRQQDEP